MNTMLASPVLAESVIIKDLLVPVVLMIVTGIVTVFGRAIKHWWQAGSRELERKRQTEQSERDLEEGREEVLREYIKDMKELILEKALRSSDPKSETWSVARGLTLAVLGKIGGPRKGQVLRFLYESKLIMNPNEFRREDVRCSIRLNDADLSGTILRGCNIKMIRIRGANLRGADLRDSKLSKADLFNADLSDADLRGVNLGGSDLRGSRLRGAKLDGAQLGGSHTV